MLNKEKLQISLLYRYLIVFNVNPKIKLKIWPEIEPEKASEISPCFAKDIVVRPS